MRSKEKVLNIMLAVFCGIAMLFCACEMNADAPKLQEIRPEDNAAEGRGQEDPQPEEALPPDGQAAAYAVSDVEAAVRCEGDYFYKLQFAAGGRYVYVCGSKREPPEGGSLGDDTYFVGVAEAPAVREETCQLRELPIEMPEDMRVFRMTVDDEGNCHLLWVSKAKKEIDGPVMEAFTYEKSEITVLNVEGEVLRRIDTTEALTEVLHGAMYCFAVDGAGAYYVEQGSEVVKIGPDGKLQFRAACRGGVESVGCGRSGAVYCACRGEDDVEWLCRIGEDGGVEILTELPHAVARNPYMGAGTDTELILFYKDGGIYAVEEGQAELRVPESEMPVSGQDMGGAGVLGDGRACLYYQDDSAIIFYYIPVGREAAGGSQDGQGKAGRGQDASVILKLAVFGRDPELSGQVAEYNRTHRDCQIVEVQYERSEVPEEDGIAKLQREIVTGKGPDLIDFGQGYATSDIVGGYTEDLWPYFLAEREESGQDYFDNILEAFRYNGKLYAMPVSFTMQTFAGSRGVLDGRENWDIREMMECYQNRGEAVILYPGETKKDVFGTLMQGSLDYYVDWETGECFFDSAEFAQVLEFSDLFPDTLRITEDYSVKQVFYEGGALLYPLRMSEIYDICSAEYIFGAEDITYIGFPVEEGSGTVIAPSSTMLAISAGSGHKEEAWEFISGFLNPEYQAEAQGYPLLRSVLEERLAAAGETEYGEDAAGNPVPVVKHRIQFEGEEPVEIYQITREQAESLLELIDTAHICSAGDYGLYSILLEEAEAYFSGDKNLEETCRIIQSRAKLYVSERVK